MADLLIRGLDDDLVKVLKDRAERNGRSLNTEIKDRLRGSIRYTPEEFLVVAKRLRDETGPMPGDSTDLIRELRDSR
jgi:plasmid stability protein